MTDASTALRADLILALSYYASPTTYESIRVLADPPCGDFRFDFADTGESYGHVARATIKAVADLTGVDASPLIGQQDPDHALMERLGIDVTRRYNPPLPEDWDEEADGSTDCCHQRKQYLTGRLQPGPLPSVCPFCEAPVDESSLFTEDGVSNRYLCSMKLHACGHFSHGLFPSDSERCIYMRSLRARAQGQTSPLDIEQAFIDEFVNGEEGFGRVSAIYDEHGEVMIKAYLRSGFAEKQLPDEFMGIRVVVQQIS